MNENEAEALEVLRHKRAELGTKAVAEALGYGESTIRLVCTGNYSGSLEKIMDAVRRIYINAVLCPYVERSIPLGECQDRSTSPRPFGGRAREQWWLACQDCPHKQGKNHG